MKFYKHYLLTFSCLFFLVSCGSKFKSQPNKEITHDMLSGPQLNAQEYDDETGAASVRLPPKGTLPQGFEKNMMGMDLALADRTQSPLKNLPSEEHIQYAELGEEYYNISCKICHGETGAGDGKVASFMVRKPPSLLSLQARTYSPGRLYQIISVGKGLMGNYHGVIVNKQNPKQNQKLRWAVVEYVRQLQQNSQR